MSILSQSLGKTVARSDSSGSMPAAVTPPARSARAATLEGMSYETSPFSTNGKSTLQHYIVNAELTL